MLSTLSSLAAILARRTELDPAEEDTASVATRSPDLSRRLTRWLDRFARLLLAVQLPLIGAILLTVFSLSYFFALYTRFDGAIPPEEWHVAITILPLVLTLKLAWFIGLGSHRGWCRYNTFADMIGVAKASSAATLSIAATTFFARVGVGLPRSVIFLDWAATILLVGGIRAAIRLFRERYYPRFTRIPARPVLLIGATDSSVAIARQIHSQPELGMRVVGLLDDNPRVKGHVLAGIKVLGRTSDVGRHAARLGVRTVLVPSPQVTPNQVRELISTCNEVDVHVQVVPGFDALLRGHMVLQPRDVDIHDLLYRDPVRLNNELVGKFLRNRSVLVTGAAGSIGSELCRQLLAFRPARLILLDHSENGLFYIERELRESAGTVEILPRVASITNASRIRAIFAELAPDVVFHAAAHKHVPMMEANPGEAVRNNVFGTRTLVDEAVRANVDAFVMVSTDKAVNPTSVMGACKRIAEMYVQALSNNGTSRLMTVRFGNVLGSNGSVVPVFKEQIRRGGPVTVTHPEMTRYFMTIPEATQLVLQAGALGWGGEIFVLDMGQPVKVVDLARDLIRLSGLQEGRDIQIVFTGLRPGEKLYEELYDSDEQRLSTPHPKIFSAKHRPTSLDWLLTEFDRLAEILDGPPEEVFRALGRILPEYRGGRPREALALHGPSITPDPDATPDPDVTPDPDARSGEALVGVGANVRRRHR